MEIDLAARVVRRDGEAVHLTPIEFDLLRTLARNRGRLMTHRKLLAEVWGAEYVDDIQPLRTHIARLRAKIEPDDACGAALHRDRPRGRLPLLRFKHRRLFTTIAQRPRAVANRYASSSDVRGAHSGRMDVVAIALGIVMFAILLADDRGDRSGMSAPASPLRRVPSRT